jgi:hypothetical protein
VAQTLSTSLSILFHVPQMTDDPFGGELAARPLSEADEDPADTVRLLAYRAMTLNMLL